MKTYENLDSSAIHSLKLDESQVKVVYKSNIAKEYAFSCENVTQFDEKLAYIISELELNHTNVSIGRYLSESVKNGSLVAVNNWQVLMGKRYQDGNNSKYKDYDDDFEDFGYEVKNIRRQTKKKVTKFKREVNEYDDTF